VQGASPYIYNKGACTLHWKV